MIGESKLWSAEILENDTVKTSGMGGIYPKGIMVGTVSSIEKTKNVIDYSYYSKH